MKKVGVYFLSVLLLVSFVSAGGFSLNFGEWFGKITGNAVSYGSNLVSNPGFDNGLTGWGTDYGGQYGRVFKEVRTEGSNKYGYLKITSESKDNCWPGVANPSHCNSFLRPLGKVGANESYIARAKIRSETTQNVRLVLVASPHDSGVKAVHSPINSSIYRDTGWIQVETPVLTTDDIHRDLDLRIYIESDKANHSLAVDDVEVVKVTTVADAPNMCYDSDGGDNIYLSGELNLSYYNATRFVDFCRDSNSLTENVCSPDQTASSYLAYCENGCVNGACVNVSTPVVNQTNSSCVDSDGGLNYYEKGIVNDSSGRSATDVCFDTNQLFEFKCEESTRVSGSYPYNCPNGCFEGACVEGGSFTGESDLVVADSGDYVYIKNVYTSDSDGRQVDLPILYGDKTQQVFIGLGKDSDENLAISPSTNSLNFDLNKDSAFVVSSFTWDGVFISSYVMEITHISDSDPRKNTVNLVSKGSGNSLSLDVGKTQEIGKVAFTLVSADFNKQTVTIYVSSFYPELHIYLNRPMLYADNGFYFFNLFNVFENSQISEATLDLYNLNISRTASEVIVYWENNALKFKDSGLFSNNDSTNPDEPEICESQFSCTIDPIICPANGVQIKTCSDVACETESYTETVSCNPGVCSGCQLDEKCIPYGFRTEVLGIASYCDISGELKAQKKSNLDGTWATCQNNYECDSNICSSGECIDLNAIAKEASAFAQLWSKISCNLADLFGIESYSECMASRFANYA